MAIPEKQLETWSHQGAIRGSSDTYNSIKNVLESKDTPYYGMDFSVFLQGSYGNDTNIYAESDVDVVICLNSVFQSDKSGLDLASTTAWDQAYSNATYTHVDFKKDVLKVLTEKYGKDVTDGKKAIMVEANGSRRKADVIVAIQYRRYYSFSSIQDQSYDKGICFYTSSGEKIANYPKQHRENMTTKHQATSGWLKPMVRIMKNLRSKLISDGAIKAGLAPSYYIEGLLYNVPADRFHTDYETCFVNAYNWILEANKNEFVCANNQYYLLRDGYSTCWPPKDCNDFLDAAGKLWKEW